MFWSGRFGRWIYPVCDELVKLLFMDQGVAAVWAAGVAGFASAAGAAVGAGVMARGVRNQVLQQSELDSLRQRRDELKQNCAAFQATLREALFALEESAEAMRAASDEAHNRLRKAILAVHTGHFDHVMTHATGNIVNVAAEALDRLQRAGRALDTLRRNPGEATPDSPSYLHWLDQQRSYLGAYEMFCKEVQQQVTNEARTA
ncbi:hypothetical protein [Streptomyces mesophilus]|uniref:hypothetical protein n=1 Tax=Streptomyces mesophilus TaxID=1775132 RepID=UPI00332CFFFF